MKEPSTFVPQRRGFLNSLGKGAAALGLASIASTVKLNAAPQTVVASPLLGAKDPADVWFGQVKGSHRVVFDATQPHQVMPFAWPKIFIMTNGQTGTPATDCGVVLVLRHDAIAYAFKDALWAKYHFDETFKAGEVGEGFMAADAATATKTRNPFWMTKPGDFQVPGFGAVPIGIKDLQADGVMICVCNAAMTVFTAAIAGGMGLKAEDVYNEWKANIIPGIQLVPSGVWALGRAQEHGCQYIFAG
jgi:hypothetical protein